MGNIRQRCPKCGRYVDGEYESGSSVSQDTRSGLSSAAKIVVKAGQAFDFLPGGRIVGGLLSAGAKELINSTADSMTTPSGYKFKCHCGHSWMDYAVSTSTYKSKLNKYEVIARIKMIIMDKLSVEEEEITNDANFQNDLGADSLDAVDLIMEFERVFDICIPDDEAEKITTVGEAIRYITSRVC